MYKVSVIMPIFNAGKYLENTLNSVINQTIGFENIELILVDDCSTDNSKDIIEKYSNNYPNIKKIFLEKNTGWPGTPRNIGIENATSDYIMFIDDDDEYLPEICDKLYNTIILENADNVVCNVIESHDFKKNSENNVVENSWKNSERIILNEDIIYFDSNYIWNRIFKKSIILNNDLKFIDGIYEDTLFIFEYSINSKKLVYLNDYTGYHHILRENSVSTFSLDKQIETINAFYTIVKVLEKNGDTNQFFKNKIRICIGDIVLGGNKNEIKLLFSKLYDFEKEINFKGTLPMGFNLINYFILHKNFNIATYIALFFSKLLNSNLIEYIYRKFVLKK